jgi:hypothetical protein
MIYTVGETELSIKPTGQSVTVGNAFYQKLNYYLSCCASFVNIPYNYKNYSSTTCPSRDELLELRRLCRLYSPVKMEFPKNG